MAANRSTELHSTRGFQRSRIFAFALSLLLAAVFSSPVHAGGGPENVVVVVNQRSWASQVVANAFIEVRQIPPLNVVLLDLPEHEQIDVDTFREAILLPTLKAVEARGIANQIDYVVYSADVPTAIDVKGDVGEAKLPEVLTPTASINGLTYLYRYALAKNPGYLRLDVNRYMRLPAAVVALSSLSADDRRRLEAGVKLLEAKSWKDAAAVFEGLAERHAKIPVIHYYHARALARTERAEDAIAALYKAKDAGWTDREQLFKEDDLKSLHEYDGFQEVAGRMSEAKFEVAPSRGFRASYTWDVRGEPVGDSERYLLSTVLAVTSGRGNSVREAVAALERSVRADATQPKGTIYFLENDDIRSTARSANYPAVAAKLKAIGVPARIEPGSLPQGKADVLGLVTGIPSFDFAKSGSTILPGAICEHFTSFGGVMHERSGQTPLSEFIRFGAAGASGTVAEPFRVPAKFPSPFVQVHYAEGCSLAEAFYQSVYGPYQLLIVGDPLCQPWAKPPVVELEGLPHDRKVRGVLALWPTLAAGSRKDIARFELFLDGRRIGVALPWEKFELDTRTHADGPHELRIVAIASDRIESQGRIVETLEFDNYGQRLVVEAGAQQRHVWGQPITLSTRLPGAERIAFYLHDELVGTIEGETGKVELDSKRLGMGLVAVRPIGLSTTPEVRRVQAAPIRLEIVPPPALAGQTEAAVGERKPGLLLTRKDGPPAVIDNTRGNNWLGEAGLKDDEAFTLQGYFHVEAEDVYQFQLRTALSIQLKIDDTEIPVPSGDGWQFVPVALLPGWHRFSLTSEMQAPGRLAVRFGGRGALSLDRESFSHPAAAEKPD